MEQETRHQRIAREQRERQEARAKRMAAARKKPRRRPAQIDDQANRFCPRCETHYTIPAGEIATCWDCGSQLQPLARHIEDRRDADKIDGYDRDDLGESPDY